jgi:hypothetical protein
MMEVKRKRAKGDGMNVELTFVARIWTKRDGFKTTQQPTAVYLETPSKIQEHTDDTPNATVYVLNNLYDTVMSFTESPYQSIKKPLSRVMKSNKCVPKSFYASNENPISDIVFGTRPSILLCMNAAFIFGIATLISRSL